LQAKRFQIGQERERAGADRKNDMPLALHPCAGTLCMVPHRRGRPTARTKKWRLRKMSPQPPWGEFAFSAGKLL